MFPVLNFEIKKIACFFQVQLQKITVISPKTPENFLAWVKIQKNNKILNFLLRFIAVSIEKSLGAMLSYLNFIEFQRIMILFTVFNQKSSDDKKFYHFVPNLK